MTSDPTGGATSKRPASVRGPVGRLRLRAARACGWAAMATVVLPLLVNYVARWFGFFPWEHKAQINGMMGMLVLFGPPLLVAVGSRFGKRPAGVCEGELRVAGDALVIEREGRAPERIPLADVEAGLVNVRAKDSARLDLVLCNGDVLTVERAARTGSGGWMEFLREARLDAAHRRVTLKPSGSPTPLLLGANLVFWIMLAVATFAKTALPDVHGMYWAPIIALFASALLGTGLASAVVGDEVTVGTDGVRLGSWRGTRFVPYSQVVSIDATSGPKATLVLRTGERVALGSVTALNTRALVERIREGMATQSESPESAAGAEDLDRGGKTIASWREALVAIARVGGSYRSGALLPEQLRDVVSDPDAPAQRRLAAAMILKIQGETPDVERIRVAAAACADDRVRVAFEHIADGRTEDTTLDAATREASSGAGNEAA